MFNEMTSQFTVVVQRQVQQQFQQHLPQLQGTHYHQQNNQGSSHNHQGCPVKYNIHNSSTKSLSMSTPHTSTTNNSSKMTPKLQQQQQALGHVDMAPHSMYEQLLFARVKRGVAPLQHAWLLRVLLDENGRDVKYGYPEEWDGPQWQQRKKEFETYLNTLTHLVSAAE
jgi:hypothetical protein